MHFDTWMLRGNTVNAREVPAFSANTDLIPEMALPPPPFLRSLVVGCGAVKCQVPAGQMFNKPAS